MKPTMMQHATLGLVLVLSLASDSAHVWAVTDGRDAVVDASDLSRSFLNV